MIINKEKAEHLELCAQMLAGYAKVLRGEVEDLTGIGQWQIFCINLEMAMNVKIVPNYPFVDKD